MQKKASFVINGERVRVELETKPAQLIGTGKTIDFAPIPADALELSICGDYDGGGGQIVDSIREAGKGIPDIQRLCDIWERWHLNGMKAGTRAQNEALEGFKDELADAGANRYTAACNILANLGLYHVPTGESDAEGKPVLYKYGSAWLYEPLPDDIAAEAVAILDRLKGKRFGYAPDVDDAPDLDGDVIDSRDVIKRLEIYREAVESCGFDADTRVEDLPEDTDDETRELVEELNALTDLESEASGSPDWRYGETLIAESYFERYAEQFAEDIGAVNRDSTWPNNHIDWKAAADELKHDYFEVTYRGDTYLIRA